LIQVIQEALVRNKKEIAEKLGEKTTKKQIGREVEALFQVLPKYREEIIIHSPEPEERIVIFDEAQRMWNQEKTDSYIKEKLNLEPMGKSETDVVIGQMDKHDGWAVII